MSCDSATILDSGTSAQDFEIGAALSSTCPAISNRGVASQSSQWQNNKFPAELAVDGNKNTFTHTAAGQSPASWRLEFDTSYVFDQVFLQNRAGFESRLRDITVSVLDDTGGLVYQSALLNPENTLNSPVLLEVNFPAGVTGRTLVVERTPDNDLSGLLSGRGSSESAVLSLAEVAVYACDASADGAINWSAPIDTTGKEQLLEGEVFLAINGGPGVTVSNGGVNATQDYSFAASSYNQLDFEPTTTSRTYTGVGSAPTGDANFDTLINSFAFSTANIVNGTQTIEGLIPGHTYSVQLFFNDQRSRFTDRTMSYVDASNSALQVDLRADGMGWGQHAIGQFTATGDSLELSHSANGFDNVHYNAILIVDESAAGSDAIQVGIYADQSPTSELVEVYFTFSEEIDGLQRSDLAVSNGTVLSVSGEGRFYTATIQANSPGRLSVDLIPNSVNSTTSGSTNSFSSLSIDTDFHTGESWIIDDQSEWLAAQGRLTNISVQDGQVSSSATGTYRSNTRLFSAPQKIDSITFQQAPIWDNWTSVDNVGPSGARDAPVLLPLGNDNYYFLGLGATGGYHAWHSTDMINWVQRGPVVPPGDGRWVTSAEHKDGRTYIYADAPNDLTPHLFIDDNLDDGVAGDLMGAAFVKEACGSDASFFRNDTDGLFHIIYEDWSPISANKNSWDSPLAGHASSVDGFTGFEHHEHLPPVDHRTTPSGVMASYAHPQIGSCDYEVHSPAQDAYGDWTTIKIGDQYYLFGDYDLHDEGIKVARFTSDSIYKEFELVGSLGNGHPDPTVGFAEGQFYLITQQAVDYVSPGPWVDGVQARVGVDISGDSVVDQWTNWQSIKESYDHKPGYARVVETTPAQVDVSSLPAGLGFKFQFRLDNNQVPDTSLIMDRVEMNFTAQ